MSTVRPTPAQGRYLARGLDQPGGKLPLFDTDGQQIAAGTIESCVRHGWAKPWFANPIKPKWLVCRLTEQGRKVAEADRARAEAPGRGAPWRTRVLETV